MNYLIYLANKVNVMNGEVEAIKLKIDHLQSEVFFSNATDDQKERMHEVLLGMAYLTGSVNRLINRYEAILQKNNILER
jgi:hypothetical protein